MPNKRKTYILSETAKQDLVDVFEFTVSEFGFDQAVSYVSSFDEIFESIVQNNELGRVRNDIRQDLRSLTKQSHIVFYTITAKNRIRIIRVLHGSIDLPKSFKE